MIRSTREQAREMFGAASTSGALHRNEKVWTLLVADALDSATDQAAVCQHLCGEPVAVHTRLDPWFEAQPMSPRRGIRGNTEGNTRLDLAFGSVVGRAGTSAGITYGPHRDDSWICFVEAKCLSDISTAVSFDPRRNQLIRVIENALCFRTAEGGPARLYVTLLTPRRFMKDEFSKKSRLYGYKMAEYSEDPAALRRDVEGCGIPWREPKPELDAALARVHLHWASFESLLEPYLGVEGLDITDPGVVRLLPDLPDRVRAVVEKMS